MTSINDYFYDDLLIILFEYLDYESRVNCRQVCVRWLSLLMTDFKFKSDRKLFLSNCSIHPDLGPVSILMASQFAYETLVISKSALNWVSPYEDNAMPFFEFLGQSITEMILTDFGVDRETHQIFKALPLLRRLKIRGTNSFLKIKDLIDLNCLALFANLNDLEISSPLCIDRICDLKLIMPNLKSLNFTDFAHLESRHLRNLIKLEKDNPGLLRTMYLPMFQENRDDGKHKNEIIECIKRNFALQRIIHTSHVPLKASSVSDVLDECRNINEIFLYCTEVPEITSFNHISVLEIKLTNEYLPNLSPLNALSQLKRLEIEVKESSCCFGHNALNLTKVEILKLIIWKSNCNECYQAISRSFPFLREFQLITFCNATPRGQIKSFFSVWSSSLSELTIRHANSCIGIPLASELNGCDKICSALKSLHLGNNIVINGNSIDKLCLFCPNLLTFKFHVGSASPPIERTLEKFLIAMPRLRTLLIHPSETCFFNVTFDEASMIIEIIIKYGRNLRNLTIPTHYKTNHTHAMKSLFKNLEYLSFVQLKEMDSRRYGYVMSRVKYLESMQENFNKLTEMEGK
uniref:CSON013948 protein n=1 Tax=Culicoides sonorensis TaxID=179676 RepID=A0A336MA31_CULSO